MATGSSAEAGPPWLRDFFPGYFALVMGTGINAVAARLLYVAATHDYATEAHQYFLYAISNAVFWAALLAWVLTFIGMWVQLLRSRSAPPQARSNWRARR